MQHVSIWLYQSLNNTYEMLSICYITLQTDRNFIADFNDFTFVLDMTVYGQLGLKLQQGAGGAELS